MLYIRTDMNAVIATGHVMRCLSVAGAVKALGGQVVFVLSDDSGVSLIEGRGFKTIVLDSDWRDLGDGQEKILELLASGDIVLVDSYSRSFEFMSNVREKAYVIYMDDINAEKHPVDGLICYAPYYEQFRYREQYPDADLLLGTEYAPLREEYAGCGKKIISDRIRNVLVLSGGSDSCEAIPKILQCLADGGYEAVWAVCGMYSVYYDRLVSEYGSLGNVHILKSVSNLKKYMEKADLAITAGGSTLYELCAVGTPSVSYSFADNQLPNVRAFAEQGVIPCAGDFRDENVLSGLQAEIGKMQDFSVRQRTSGRMQQMVDGKGAGRIAEFLRKIGKDAEKSG